MVDRELANFGCGNGDLVYYSVLVSKLTNQVANSVRNASVACEMDFAGSVSIEEDSDSVIRYLKHAGVVGKDTVTVVNLSSHLVEVKTVLLEEQLGQRTGSGMGIYALDPIFLNLIIQKYPQVRKVLEASQVVAKEFLISFKQLKHAFENGSQWTTGAYRIGIPPALKHLFKVLTNLTLG